MDLSSTRCCWATSLGLMRALTGSKGESYLDWEEALILMDALEVINRTARIASAQGWCGGQTGRAKVGQLSSLETIAAANGFLAVYAYIPTPNGLCSNNGIICNDDFGVSIHRGSFSFVPGQWVQWILHFQDKKTLIQMCRWNRITMLVQMNNPPNVANGNLQLLWIRPSLYFEFGTNCSTNIYSYNDVQALSQTNLQFRSGSSVTAGGLYLSTFYGGNDESWAPSNTTHSYFRNFRLWGSSAPSNLTGSTVSAATSTHEVAWLFGIICLAFCMGTVGFWRQLKHCTRTCYYIALGTGLHCNRSLFLILILDHVVAIIS